MFVEVVVTSSSIICNSDSRNRRKMKFKVNASFLRWISNIFNEYFEIDRAIYWMLNKKIFIIFSSYYNNV